MSKKNNKISVAEIDKMITEEIAKIRKIEQIKSRLAMVNEELSQMSEDTVDEVSVGGTRNGKEWYEKGTPVAKFEKKGSHLKEEEPMMGDDLGMDDSIDMGGEVAPETFEEKMAAIGRELDMKLDGMGGEDVDTDVDDIEIADDTTDGPEMDMDAEDSPEEGAEDAEEDETAPEEEEDAEIEIDEVADAEECEEGAPMMNESVDRLGKKKNTLLSKELQRMARLSGL